MPARSSSKSRISSLSSSSFASASGAAVQRQVVSRPAPVGREFEVPLVARHQQQARRAVGDVGQRFDRTLLQGDVVEPGGADRVGKADPLGAVVVPVLEQVLDRGDPQPAAQAVRRQPDQRQRTRRDDQAHLCQPGQIAAEHVEPARDAQHHCKIPPDQQQREEAEGDRTRRAEGEFGRIAREADRRRVRRRSLPPVRAGSASSPRRRPPDVGDGEIVEVEGPQPRQGSNAPSQDLARGRGGTGIEIVQQHQRADRHHHAEQRRGIECQQRKLGRDRIAPGDEQQEELHDLDQHQRDHHRSHQPQGLVAAIIAEQAEQDEQPREIAGDLGQSRRSAGPARSWPRRSTSWRSAPQRRPRACGLRARGIALAPDPDRRKRADDRTDGVGDIGQVADETHHRAPSGQRMTRAVWNRIERSRNGVYSLA